MTKNISTALRDLDDAIADFHKEGRRFSTVSWRMGVILNRIREQDLWRHRVDSNGEPVHSGFEAFVLAELGVKRGSASGMMRVASTFSEEDVSKYGLWYLDIVRRAPAEEDRARLKKAIADGCSYKELKALAKEAPGYRDKPGFAAQLDVPEDVRIRREKGSRKAKRLRAKWRKARGPGAREIAAEVIADASPLVDFDKIVRLANVELSNTEIESVRNDLAELLEERVRGAVVTTVWKLRRAHRAQPAEEQPVEEQPDLRRRLTEADVPKMTPHMKSIFIVDLSCVKRSTMLDVLDAQDIDGSGLTDEQLALVLVDRFQHEQGELLRCDHCRGDSPLTEPTCPYCGTGGVGEDVATLTARKERLEQRKKANRETSAKRPPAKSKKSEVRHCDECDKPIPKGRHRNVVTCSVTCATARHRRQSAASAERYRQRHFKAQ